MDREREIVKGSAIGIAGNLVLVAFKLVVGFTSHSIAIVLDGVNNATDALSSAVTIGGVPMRGTPSAMGAWSTLPRWSSPSSSLLLG